METSLYTVIRPHERSRQGSASSGSIRQEKKNYSIEVVKHKILRIKTGDRLK